MRRLLAVLVLASACSSPATTGVQGAIPDGLSLPDLNGFKDLGAEKDVASGSEVTQNDVAGTDNGTGGCTDDKECANLSVGCKVGKCAAGKCGAVDADSGTACDDGDKCTESDQCKTGSCQGIAKSCDDSNGCTVDACEAGTGNCTHKASTASCDDGDLCTENDACKDGKCTGSPSKTCGCKTDEDCAKTDDADLCNGIHTCQGGQCLTKPGSEVSCDSSKPPPCQHVDCDPSDGKCKMAPLANGSQCDDGDKCSKGDVCTAGSCAGEVVSCDDSNACTNDSCDKLKGCVNAPNTAACNDGDLCTNDDACAGGKCGGTANPNCSKCSTDADCAKFEDGDLCNGVLVCAASACVVKPGSVVTCAADANPCKVNACAPTTGKCAVDDALDGGKCDDGDACTSGDHCASGACGGKAVVCSDDNPCTSASCDKVKGCVFSATDGAACDDDNPCTTDDKCAGDNCGGSAAANCANCKVDADCAKADDADLCNGTLMCASGKCVVNPASVVECSSDGLSVCVSVACQPSTGKCSKTNVDNGTVCDDQNACTNKDYCSSGVCKGKPVSCDDGQLCTDDSCDPDVGCAHKFNDSPCDDGNPCTVSDACSGGSCGGKLGETCVCTKNADCIDDGDLCNGTLICVGSKCVVDPATIVSCSQPADVCSTNACDSATGKCALSALADGKACDDKSACTAGDQCSGGKCVGGSAVTCDDKNVCTNDKCNPEYGCTHASNTASCDDGNDCTSGDKCAFGSCQPGSPVSTPSCSGKCAPNYNLACGSSDGWKNDGIGATNAISKYPCNSGDSYAGPEYTYAYVAPYDGTVTVTLSKETAETDVLILDGSGSDCDPAMCLGWGPASASVSVKAGKTYYIVIDGYNGAVGTYTLDVSCVPDVESNCGDGSDEDQDGKTDCDDGDCSKAEVCAPPVCSAGWVISCGGSDSWGTAYAGSTDLVDGYGCSPYAYGNSEFAYSFTPDVSGKVTVTLSNKSADLDVLVIDGAGGVCSSSKCMTYDPGSGELTFDAIADHPYFLVVDGYNGAVGTYSIHVECAGKVEDCGNGKDDDGNGATDCEDAACFGKSNSCQPACTPDSVELAQLACPSDKDYFQNDGSGSTDVITKYGCNPSFEYDGSEYAYTYVANEDTNVTVTLSNETAGNQDTDVIVLHDAGLGCNPASCIASGTVSANFTAKKGDTYYVIVDGYGGANGSYDLAFSCGAN